MLRDMAETIVTGFDGKSRSEQVLARAIELAAGGELVVVVGEYGPVDPGMPSMVYEPTFETIPVPDPDAPPPPTLAPIIDRAKSQADAAGVSPRFVWGAGDPARLIVDTARDVKATKIVIGADHHSFFGKLLGEDVEAEVKREAACEVVVVE
jgi:nucleotide-binding universal stress UspA family protein